jgi:hypothetical protein
MMLFPKHEVIVPVQAVTGCEIVSWHIGKSKNRPLLKVLFRDEKGEDDSIAWLIGDPQQWKREIEGSISYGI